MLKMLEKSSITGTSRVELEEELKEIDSRTSFTRELYPWELHLMYTKGIPFEVSPNVSHDEMNVTKTYKRLYEDRFVYGDAELEEEANQHGWFCKVELEPDTFIFGERAMKDLLRLADLNGKLSEYHTPELIEAALKYLTNEDGQIKDEKGRPVRIRIKLMYRRDGNGNCKVLSVRSAKYSAIPQTNILSTIDGIRGCGKPEVKSFEITNFLTTVFVDFPEIAEDYKKTFALEEEVTPGIRFQTSDSGDSAFKTTPTLNIGNTESLPIPVARDRKNNVSKRHFGTIVSENILAHVNAEIFGNYKQWPEMIAKLSMIRTKIPVMEALQEIFSSMEFQKKSPVVISEEKENRIVKELAELYGKASDTPYKIAKFATKAAELEFLSQNQKDHLKRYLLLAFMTDFSKIIERSNQYVA